MNRLAFGAAVLALALSGCDSTPSEPAGALTLKTVKDDVPDKQKERAPFSRTVNNPCPPIPEMVLVEGKLFFRTHFKHFEGGNTLKSRTFSHGTGIGLTTGVHYSFHEQFRLDATYDRGSNVFDSDRTTRWHVISATGLGNFFATTREHVVCTGGVCEVEVIAIETDCRG